MNNPIILAIATLVITQCAGCPLTAKDGDRELPTRTAFYDRCDAGAGSVLPGTLHVYTSDGRCTGVVIGEHTVLTAGHCVWNSITSLTVQYTDDGPEYEATHAFYGGPNGEDVAILYVPDLPVDAYAAPIGESYPGEILYFSGYGCKGEGGQIRTMQRSANEYPNEYVQSLYGCACHGDSGGPVFTSEGALAGVLTNARDATNAVATDTRTVPYMLKKLKEMRSTSLRVASAPYDD